MSEGKWQAVIGLEVHVQLDTKSKSFSDSAVQYGAAPNTLCDPTVLALPGALPVFNDTALEFAIRLGLALGCQIRRDSRFARKHYFYPDQPAGYQISQFEEPLCLGGAVPLLSEAGVQSVALNRIHLENDAGKNTHVAGGSLVDLNRCGVALCEVVSEPVLDSAAQAADYMRSLRQIVRYIGVSEGDMEKGQLRCDANVSVKRPEASTLGTRTELKNINSFKFVEKAIEHEIARQIRVIEGGESIVQETRLWDADAGLSRSMRSKEEAMDYRYFPDPDLPVLRVSEERIARIGESLPELPAPACQRLVAMGLSYDDATHLTGERALLQYFDACSAAFGGDAKLVANWIQGGLMGELNRLGLSISESPTSPESLAGLIARISDQTISGKIAKTVLATMIESGESADAIIAREGLEQITDTGAIEAKIDEILAANADTVQKYKEGNAKLLGFFVGQVMKATQGQANPKMVNELLRKKIG